jgi:hypothetical protein
MYTIDCPEILGLKSEGTFKVATGFTDVAELLLEEE